MKYTKELYSAASQSVKNSHSDVILLLEKIFLADPTVLSDIEKLRKAVTALEDHKKRIDVAIEKLTVPGEKKQS